MPIAVLAVTAALVGALATTPPAQAAAGPGPLVTLPASAAPRLPPGATRLGAVPAGTALTVDVTLRVRDQAALDRYLAGLSSASSPLFDRYLAPGQFGARFGPTPAQVTAVKGALRAAGLAPGPVSPDGLSIPVTATAAAITRALNTSLVRYRVAGGRVAYANAAAPAVPAAVASLVSGFVGLNTLYPAQNMIVRPTRSALAGPRPQVTVIPAAAGPQACGAATSAAAAYGGLTAGQLAAHYGISPLWRLGDEGQGTRVAVVEFEPNLASDITRYTACYRISPAVKYIAVDGGAGRGQGSGEAALDIEDIAGLAPRAAIDVYRAPNAGAGSYDDYRQIITADTDTVISTSWGVCEAYLGQSSQDAMETLFEEASAQGQTVVAAAGDSGSTACLPSGGARGALVDPLTPASLPYVVGVGGTEITAKSEVTWNESAHTEGAGGGGISTAWCMPAYQYRTAIPGLVNPHSQTSSTCAGHGGYRRQVPDVSADADPYTGYVVNWDGYWQTIAGTSAAAPLWAAIAALTDASPFCADYGSGNAGMLPQGLYAAVAAAHAYVYSGSPHQGLNDVTRGNDDYTPSGYQGGLYPAGPGFDEATGLGVPRVAGLTAAGTASNYYPGLTALLCRYYRTKLKSTAVTSISPAHGKAGTAVKVTVHGTGFLPISGADVAVVGPTHVAASCPSATECTLTVPRRGRGTDAIRISAEDGPASAVTAGSKYTYR